MFAVGGEASDRETRKLSESEGLVDERPINLYDYKSDQFADFLWMFYHRCATNFIIMVLYSNDYS
jgi:hypothetical protein